MMPLFPDSWSASSLMVLNAVLPFVEQDADLVY